MLEIVVQHLGFNVKKQKKRGNESESEDIKTIRTVRLIACSKCDVEQFKVLTDSQMEDIN